MKNYRTSEKVNAGSMADIAFLLLIFFLVTTTIAIDKGINRNLPEECPIGVDCTKTIHERNVLRIRLNSNNEILVEEEITSLDSLEKLVFKHIDNNGNQTCDYCKGESLSNFSDNPKDAVISIEHNRDTNYTLFISVQDEISKAYHTLRSNYAKTKYEKALVNVTASELLRIKKDYPIQISEAVINN